MTLSIYLRQDRLYALARGQSLPDSAHGSVLFADISSFTPLAQPLSWSQESGARFNMAASLASLAGVAFAAADVQRAAQLKP